MAENTPYSVSFVTINDETKAVELATKIVESQLAACVNIIPKVRSIYQWKGKIEDDSELILMIKSRQSKLPQLTDFVKINHPYEVCEVISLPIQHGNQAYLDWIGAQVPENQPPAQPPKATTWLFVTWVPAGHVNPLYFSRLNIANDMRAL